MVICWLQYSQGYARFVAILAHKEALTWCWRMTSIDTQSQLLQEVTSSPDDVARLYRLLEQRQFKLSHDQMPEFEQHRIFVEQHPYRKWYFVNDEKDCAGSVYLTDSNHIGINILSAYSRCIAPALQELLHRHEPLPAIASIRPACFVVNVSPQNEDLIEALSLSQGTLIQHTYRLPDK